MTTILSLPAVGRLAERRVRRAGQAIPRTELAQSLEALDVDRERAHAGIDLATTTGRLVETPDGVTLPVFKDAA